MHQKFVGGCWRGGSLSKKREIVTGIFVAVSGILIATILLDAFHFIGGHHSPRPSPSSPMQGYSYSTAQPGPQCDTRGATWTENNVKFDGACGVEATTANQFGFLNLTLPSKRDFVANNILSIKSNLGEAANGYDAQCIGLEEDGTSGGYLGAYCNNGDWHIYSTSNEVITGTLNSGSIRPGVNGTTYIMTLAFQGTKLELSFSDVDSNSTPSVETAAVAPLQPTVVGIGYEYSGYNHTIVATDFSYRSQ
jgi:hypothetical protein